MFSKVAILQPVVQLLWDQPLAGLISPSHRKRTIWRNALLGACESHFFAPRAPPRHLSDRAPHRVRSGQIACAMVHSSISSINFLLLHAALSATGADSRNNHKAYKKFSRTRGPHCQNTFQLDSCLGADLRSSFCKGLQYERQSIFPRRQSHSEGLTQTLARQA